MNAISPSSPPPAPPPPHEEQMKTAIRSGIIDKINSIQSSIATKSSALTIFHQWLLAVALMLLIILLVLVIIRYRRKHNNGLIRNNRSYGIRKNFKTDQYDDDDDEDDLLIGSLYT